MSIKHFGFIGGFIGLVALVILAVTPVTRAGLVTVQSDATSPGGLVATVRAATEQFTDVAAAEAAGYGLFHGCVSGPAGGAMGIHMANNDLVADAALDPMRPEALLYEPHDGRLELLGVEYVVIADAWHAEHEAPPVLEGQLFNYVGGPNRYGIPAFYELHVWAWANNPNGPFADFNPSVSCEEYVAEEATPGTGH